MKKYLMFADRADGTNVVHQSDDLVRLVQMATYWLGVGVWTNANISQNPLVKTH